MHVPFVRPAAAAPEAVRVHAVCARCGARLAPAFGGRLRCPRLSACGFGGTVEDRHELEVRRLVQAFQRGFVEAAAAPA